ncbi:hypothetical protein M440DRAFT_1459264 [Trichoderma longibrachiatum ATCC 18648]|uniref:Prp31 C-terminal domain-containing protein n=1 Tax=Trichoderma longibrachiatum ATCC 18648 TaxID=983965 RepID=A0A2T4CH56_TRILO|nr:hypothetical protein M440DRAFT_1459264 [Trichoderma longibrachiatum ATCC 18648]
MSTVADDLLNDFGSSGDEAEELETDGLVLPEKAEKKVNGDRDAMDVDDDDDNEEASDDEGAAAGAGAGALNDMEDAEATKAKVEKMQLGAVKDVRSVASLMQTLEPVLERGGRRARKAKEALAMTELRKAQNRMAFGKEEKEVGYGTGEGTVGMGMIGQANDGRIRGMQVDQRTRAKLGVKSKGWGGASTLGGGTASSIGGFGMAPGMDLRGKGLRASGVGTTVGSATGTQSSLAFTPVQGLELVDPKMQAELSRKRKAEEDKWFKGGSFTQVGNGGGAGTGTGGFKVPGPPASKKVDTGATKMGPPPVPNRK